MRTAFVALALAVPTIAAAEPVTYAFTGIASGTIDGWAFSDAPVAFTLSTDTSTVRLPFPRFPNILNAGPAALRFTVDGVSGVFTDRYNAFVNGGRGASSVVGFTQVNGSDIFDISSGAVAAYDLRTAIGPITQSPVDFLNFNTAFGTSAGTLVLFDDPDTSLTFTAVLGATAGVPEPATWAMLIAGFALVGTSVRTRRATPAKSQTPDAI